MEFRLLGPVELWTAEKRHDLGSAKERTILAVLILAEGRPVSVETLIDRVWGEGAPDEVVQSLHTDVSRLRRRLKGADLEKEVHLQASSHTYALKFDREKVDLFQFRSLRVQASSMLESGDRQEAARLLRKAEELWRSKPLAGLNSAWVERTRVRLDSDYRTAALELVDIELQLGHHAQIVSYLLDLIERYPSDEMIVGRLMTAYYRCGRQVSAIDLYMMTKELLSTQNGVDPSPQLQAIYQNILCHDPSLRYVRPTPVATATHLHALPSVTPDFTGRNNEIDTLTAQPTPGVVVITGMPGVGKSTLAIRVAHEVKDRYPDAHFYVNLHAHDPQRSPAEPAAVLATLLRSLGVPPAKIPRSLPQRSRLWQNELVGVRSLLILDDAHNIDQVRPLLPASPDCQVIITSRRYLEGLDQVRHHLLDILPAGDAVSLFTRIAFKKPPTSNQDITEVVGLCGFLPLAISLTATRLRDGHAPSIGALIDQMRAARDGIDAIHQGDLATAFQLSYRDLNSRQRDLFRKLGLSPVPEITAPVLGALANISLQETEKTLQEFADHNLLATISTGRYHFHDLIRQYALASATREEVKPEIRRTTQRVLDHYLQRADHADRLLYPYRGQRSPRPGEASAGTATFDTVEQAQDWMHQEWRNLFYLIQYCVAHEWNRHVVDLAYAVAQFFDAAGHWEEAETVHRQAIRTGWSLEIPRSTAQAYLNLAVIQWRTGRTRDALTSANKARGLYGEISDATGEAATLDRIGLILWSLSDFRAALAHFDEALDIYRDIGDKHGEANCRCHAGMASLHTGRYAKAIESFNSAVTVYQSLGDLRGEAVALNNIADAQLRLGYHRDAVKLYTKSREIYQSIIGRRNSAILLINFGNVARYRGELSSSLSLYREALSEFVATGDRLNESDVLNNIGFALSEDGRYDEALAHHRKALFIADEIGNEYERTRAILGVADTDTGSGHLPEALKNYQIGRDCARRIGDPYLEAQALRGIAEAVVQTEGLVAARIFWRQAMDLFGQLGTLPELGSIQLRLEALELTTPGRQARG